MSSSHLDLPPLGPPRVDEVADGVYAYVQPDGTWWINNTGFVVGTPGVLCIDTCATERRTRAFLAAVDAVAGPVAHPGQHPPPRRPHHGNCLFPFATIIGHERCRRGVLDVGIRDPTPVWEALDWGDLTAGPPFVTFDDA